MGADGDVVAQRGVVGGGQVFENAERDGVGVVLEYVNCFFAQFVGVFAGVWVLGFQERFEEGGAVRDWVGLACELVEFVVGEQRGLQHHGEEGVRDVRGVVCWLV